MERLEEERVAQLEDVEERGERLKLAFSKGQVWVSRYIVDIVELIDWIILHIGSDFADLLLINNFYYPPPYSSQ